MGGGFTPKDIIIWSFNCTEQNGYLKIWSDNFGEKIGMGGGPVAL